MKYGVMESFRMHDSQIEYGLRSNGDRKLLFNKAKELGFQGIELGIGHTFREDQLWTGDGNMRQAIKEEARLTGTDLASICLHLLNHEGYSLASTRRGHRKLGHEIIQNCIEACSNIGGSVILMPFFGTAVLKSEKQIKFLISEMRKLSYIAEDNDVHLSLETSLEAPDMLRIIDSVDSDYVQVYFDTGNTAGGGYDIVQEIETLSDYIVQVHVKDYPGGTLGTGNINFHEVIGVLRRIGFDGYLVLETPALHNSEESALRNLTFIKHIVE
jgi:sugar phosphate isomerase/epimerase